MPLVAKGVVEEYLPDQQWAHMKDSIQAQMTKAFEAPEDLPRFLQTHVSTERIIVCRGCLCTTR